MILRKPFMFFVKYFRFWHFALAIITSGLTFKTFKILEFFNEYKNTQSHLISKNVESSLFNYPLFIWLFVVLIATTIILNIMYHKKRPIVFYLFNIAIITFSWITYMYTKNIISELVFNLVNAKTILLCCDLALITFMLQSLCIVTLVLRSMGFNVKKMKFEKDESLKEYEEFDDHFNVDIDTSKVKRNFQKDWRNFKYIYQENKMIFKIILFVVIFIILMIALINRLFINQVKKEHQTFNIDGYSINIIESYITDKDYQENKISDNQFVLVKLKIKRLTKYEEKLDANNIKLHINQEVYYHSDSYKKEFLDVGEVYQDKIISSRDYDTYILVYEIPKALKNKKMYLKYTTGKKSVKVKLNYENVDVIMHKKNYVLGNTVKFSNSALGNTTFTINNYLIAKNFKNYYSFCVTEQECYSSYEYAKPTLDTNYDKNILYIRGNFKIAKEVTSTVPNNMADFINYYGKIVYTLNGNDRVMNITLKEAELSKPKNDYDYYVEVKEELKEASSIKLVFDIRGYQYTYKLK